MMIDRRDIAYWKCPLCDYGMDKKQISSSKLNSHPFEKCPHCGYIGGLNVIILNESSKRR